MHKLLASVLISALAASAHGWVGYDLVPVENGTVWPGEDPAVPDFNDGSYYTFDLVGIVFSRPEWGGDHWLGAIVTATIDGPGTFFLHPEGSDIPSDPNLVSQYPALEFDTYFPTMSGGLPWFPPGSPSYSGPGGGIITQIDAEWQDARPSQSYYEGTFQLARFTVQHLGSEPLTLTLAGVGATYSSGALFPIGPFVVTIPEPSSLPLLALGALPVLIRRR